MSNEQIKVFLNSASIFEIERFCLTAGYCLVIENPEDFWIEKERNR